ncbi:hypothetical protein H0H93_007995 [Arthromyces matolae]|nr:hypothetical protein H0H93_007995 [Arthromyces matolae]
MNLSLGSAFIVLRAWSLVGIGMQSLNRRNGLRALNTCKKSTSRAFIEKKKRKTNNFVAEKNPTMDDDIPISNADLPSTHALRHPDKPVIAPRIHRSKKSNAEKATAAAVQLQKKARKEALQRDLKAFLDEKEKTAQILAVKHDIKVEKARKLLDGNTNLKKSRRPNIWNAKVARKRSILNQGMWLV